MGVQITTQLVFSVSCNGMGEKDSMLLLGGAVGFLCMEMGEDDCIMVRMVVLGWCHQHPTIRKCEGSIIWWCLKCWSDAVVVLLAICVWR